MTGSSAQDADRIQAIGDSGNNRIQASASDVVPDGGNIDRAIPSTPQILLAVAVLVLVTVVAFVAVFVVGELFVASRQTYWMIELIFALLCGGAGALVGGSAVVRSTLRIPGTPVHATLGGAIAMIIVGFALAYLGQPPEEAPMYALDIHNVPDRQTIGNDEYRVFVGAANSDLTFSRDPDNVSLKVPPRVGTHRLLIAVYRPVGKDLSRTFARCELSFEIIAGQRDVSTPMDLVSGGSNPQFHLYFSQQYIQQAVTAALQSNDLTADESCIEGRVATKSNKTPLDGHFTLQTNSVGSRALSFVLLSPLPRYSVLARDRSNLDPQDTQPDLPPHARSVPRLARVSSSADSSEPPRQNTSASTQIRETSGPAPKTTVSSAAPTNEEPRTLPDLSSTSTPGPTASPIAPLQPKTTPAAGSESLTDQVDAYVRGEDRDRTELYQSWGKVADYVVQGLRNVGSIVEVRSPLQNPRHSGLPVRRLSDHRRVPVQLG
ncbi:hypothetical protein [Bradyrhizobium sp. USDA 4452]